VKLAIVGAGGMLGTALVAATGDNAVAFSHADVDVTDRAAVKDALGIAHTVINCAAWTDVDGAEEHPDDAMRVNRDGARNVAEAAERVLYVSSDYVFDGRKREAYRPLDEPNPLSAYGHSKLEGERATAAANERHFIVRSSWLFGAGGGNFVDTMLRLGRERDHLRVVDDQFGCPTWTGHLAPALVELARSNEYGVHHLAAAGSCSWYELAREALAVGGVDTEIAPCTTAEFPRPAPRPAYSVLGCDGHRALPHWREGVRAYLESRA
jgi:dTDP-4-dehydrorhamnose reductase